MTVLESLLSRFRKSRTSLRRQKSRQRQHSMATESLEERLLLTDVLLIEDQAGFGGAGNILSAAGFTVTIVNNEFANGYSNILTPGFLDQFDSVVYGERGDGFGSLLPANVAASLESYIQGGGDLLVTGYDTLGSPTDPALASVVRAINPGDQVSFNPNWQVTNLDHFMVNGPFGDFRGLTFTATGYDDDVLFPNTAAGAFTIASTPGASDRIIFTDVPGNAGTVTYWNGGEPSFFSSNAQPDFIDGGTPQNIFLNWVNGAVNGGGTGGGGGTTSLVSITPDVLIEPNATFPNSGPSSAVGRVTRPASEPIDTVFIVDLVNTDPSELTLSTNQVIIPAGRSSATFNVTAEDDSQLDGDQIVTIQVTANGVPAEDVTVVVRDHEFLSVSLSPNPVREDAGPGGATLTVTRSNDDIGTPNHFVSAGTDLLEYDSIGNLVRTIPVEWHAGGTRPAGEGVRDIVALENGNIAVFNGNINTAVSIYNVTNGLWTHHAILGASATSDETEGGIASTGNFVFLTDSQANVTDSYGLIRLDITDGTFTRFGDTIQVPRLFANNKQVNGQIQELDPFTGALIANFNFTPDQPGTFDDSGMAFDGVSLWFLSGAANLLYEVNPDTGVIVSTHNLTNVTRSTLYNGLAYLNGELYLLDDEGDTTLEAEIDVYNPGTRRLVRTLNVGLSNGILLSTDGILLRGLAASPTTGTLFASGSTNNTIYEFDPATGVQLGEFSVGGSPEGLAVIGDEIYVPSSRTNQIVSYDLNGNRLQTITPSATVAPAGFNALGGDGIGVEQPSQTRFRDVTVGLDGLVYGLTTDNVTIEVYDPQSLAQVRIVTLSSAVQTLAVDESGLIYGGTLGEQLIVFDASGQQLESIDPGIGIIVDVETNISREILVTGIVGDVAQGIREVNAPILSAFTTLETAPGLVPTFGSFGRNPSRATGRLVVNIVNGDPTEISIPAQVVIEAGQQSVSVPVDVLADDLRDGTQIVTVTAIAPEYQSVSGTISVTDVETIDVQIAADQIRETDGPNATTVTVSRSDTGGPFRFVTTQEKSQADYNAAVDGPLVNPTGPVAIKDFDVTISQIRIPDQTSRIRDVDLQLSLEHSWMQDLDVFLYSPQGTRVELFTDQGLSERLMTNTIFDDEALVRIEDGASPYEGRFIPEGALSKFDGQNPSGVWTLEITDDNQQDLGTLFEWSLTITTVGLAQTVVTLVSDSPDEADLNNPGGVVPFTVTIPANQTSVTVGLDAIDDALLDGTQTATISPTNVSLPGFEFRSDTVDVLDSELLTLTTNADTVSEFGGVLIGTVTRGNTDIGSPLDVTLTSSDVTELTVPASVTILAGQSSVDFNITAVDDTELETDQTVTITAAATGYDGVATKDITVTDYETTIQLTTGTPQVREDAGSMTITVTRLNSSDISADLIVSLVSDTPDEISVPSTVTIPANSISTQFTASVIDDFSLDGTQTVTITGSSSGTFSGSLVVDVLDHETITLTVDRSSFLENGSSGTVTGTIEVANEVSDRTNPLTVTLTSSDTSEVSVPATVTIPAFERTATFTITAVNDPIIDGPQSVTITAQAAGYLDGTVGVTVLDHEPPVISGPTETTRAARPTVEWNSIPGATRYEIWISYLSGGIAPYIRLNDLPASQTSFTPTNQLALGRYRVWVRAFDSLEQPGFWSVGHDFIVKSPPVITSPATSAAAESSSPVITWTSIVDATRYDLWVRNLTTGEDQIIREQALQTSSYQTTGLEGGKYIAWVRAFGVGNNASFWSAGETFTVLTIPEVLSPTGATFETTPTIEWSAVTGATQYDLWLSLSIPDDPDTYSPGLVLRDQFVAGTSLRPEQDLVAGTYTAWVRAVADGVFSAWSPGSRFTVSGRPEVTVPNNNATTGSQPTFFWSAVSQTARYEIWVDRIDVRQRQVIFNDNVTLTSFSASAPLASGVYRVWVRAISTMGEVSAYSRPVTFTVAASNSPADQPALPDLHHSDSLLTVRRTQEPLVVQALTSSVESFQDVRVAGEPVPVANPVADASVETHAGQLPVAADATSDFDAVMADWDAAEWWTPIDESKDSMPLSAGIGLGIVASAAMTGKKTKNRNTRRTT